MKSWKAFLPERDARGAEVSAPDGRAGGARCGNRVLRSDLGVAGDSGPVRHWLADLREVDFEAPKKGAQVHKILHAFLPVGKRTWSRRRRNTPTLHYRGLADRHGWHAPDIVVQIECRRFMPVPCPGASTMELVLRVAYEAHARQRERPRRAVQRSLRGDCAGAKGRLMLMAGGKAWADPQHGAAYARRLQRRQGWCAGARAKRFRPRQAARAGAIPMSRNTIKLVQGDTLPEIIIRVTDESIDDNGNEVEKPSISPMWQRSVMKIRKAAAWC
jgi:hypothetical protein